jgi:hypothetical protein
MIANSLKAFDAALADAGATIRPSARMKMRGIWSLAWDAAF